MKQVSRMKGNEEDAEEVAQQGEQRTQKGVENVHCLAAHSSLPSKKLDLFRQ